MRISKIKGYERISQTTAKGLFRIGVTVFTQPCDLVANRLIGWNTNDGSSLSDMLSDKGRCNVYDGRYLAFYVKEDNDQGCFIE